MFGLTCFQVCNSEDTETVQSTPVSSYFTTKHRAKYAQIICVLAWRNETEVGNLASEILTKIVK